MFDTAPSHRGAVARALIEPPGAAAVAVLAEVDPVSLDADTRVDLLRAWERQAAWVAARTAQVLAAMGPAPRSGCDDDWVREEVAAALRLSGATAQRRLDTARALATRLPGTRAALVRGEIPYLHALAVSEATEVLSVQAAAAVERRVLPAAPEQTLAELRRAVRRAVLVADPVAAEVRTERAVAQRCVRMWPLPDGMAEVQATLSAEGAMTLMTALGALADRREPATTETAERPGVDARRADALVELAAAALTDPSLPRRHGHRPQIAVTVSAESLVGASEAPGELAGYGPVSAATARRIAAGGEWSRVLYDPPTGTLLDLGRTTYRPSAALAEFLLARDRVCCFPGCAVPARRCDLDHAVPFEAGGGTDSANLGALCGRHHRVKHEGGWTLERSADFSCTWTSPAGQVYRVRPPSYAPDG